MKRITKPDMVMHQVNRIVKDFISGRYDEASVDFKRGQYEYLKTLNFLNKNFVLKTIRVKMGWKV